MIVPVCYLICGFLGAGKTTYSQKLSKETGAIHLNPDQYCMELFDKTEYEENFNHTATPHGRPARCSPAHAHREKRQQQRDCQPRQIQADDIQRHHRKH